MSSRSQTKSLDRDIQSHSKSKHSFPMNIQQVNNAAEHLVCNFHNKIENLFETFPISRFEQELSADKISEYLADISSKINIDSTVLSNLNQSIKSKYSTKTTSDPFELILRYSDFIMRCQSLFHGITNKLFQAIINGLLRYCVSLARYCNSDIEFVVNYEKLIQKNEADIIKEVKDVECQNKEFRKLTSSSRTILYHVEELVSCIRKLRASINKLYYFVTEWVDEERNYPSNLSDQMKLVKSDLFTIEQRTAKNDLSIKRRQMRIVSLENQLKSFEKNHLLYKRKLRRIRNSLDQIASRLDELETQTSSRANELKSIKTKIKSLEYIKCKPEKKVKIPHYKVSMQIHAKKSEQRDFEARNIRLDDNKIALIRHKERLLKVSEQLQEKIGNLKNQITENQSTTTKLQENLQDDISCQQKDIENLKILQMKLKDINFINSKKNSPDTMRQLHHHGRLAKESRDVNLTDKMCDLVSQKVLENWKDLYINLPMFPERTLEQRCHDIDIIDAISARNDSTPKKQTRMCLDKWRLFYHNATPEHLIEGLQKSNNREIAKELKQETIKSKQRFEEDELPNENESPDLKTT